MNHVSKQSEMMATTENRCELCRWWKKALRKPEYGICENPDLNVNLIDLGSRFSPHTSFSCSLYERSVDWATDAAEEIDDRLHGVYTESPEEREERIQRFAEIVLKHRDKP